MCRELDPALLICSLPQRVPQRSQLVLPSTIAIRHLTAVMAAAADTRPSSYFQQHVDWSTFFIAYLCHGDHEGSKAAICGT